MTIRVAVLGAGSWGTAFAKVLADAGAAVRLWARRAALAAAIQQERRNPDYLPETELPDAIACTSCVEDAVDAAEIVVLALPAQRLREHLSRWRLPGGATMVSLAKGIEAGTDKRMSQVIGELTGAPASDIAVLSGPNLAHEVAAGHPAAAVIACSDADRAAWLQQVCQNRYFRPYTNTDVVGCELGGATKNVIALAAGMSHGMGFGDNTTASIITRGLAEITRLGQAMGADPRTFAGLAGLGDLVATCASPQSRNRRFGELLGRGHTRASAAAATQGVAEGVKSCPAVLDLARRNGVDMAITEGVVRVCYEGLSPHELVESLMSRKVSAE